MYSPSTRWTDVESLFFFLPNRTWGRTARVIFVRFSPRPSAVLTLLLSFQPQAQALNEISGTSMGGGWTTDLGIGIKSLWADPGIRGAFAAKDSDVNHRTVHFHLNDSAAFFFDNVDRYLVPDFIPTEQDALRARVRSTGIDEAEFAFQDLSFKMVDVGGQRSERRKWIHCFESVTAILYVCSLSEYDQYLREDETQLRMHESLLLFDEICNNQAFRKTAIILFLNKEDLFREKVQKVDLRICFPNYEGGASYENGTSFIRDRFLEKNLQPNRTIFVHFTCAINTENIEFVFKSVRHTLLNQIIGTIGLGNDDDF
jgi:GTPase SAR1 family protein